MVAARELPRDIFSFWSMLPWMTAALTRGAAAAARSIARTWKAP